MKTFILLRYVDLVLSLYFKDSTNPKKSQYTYNFRCNVCGDSKKSKKKKRGNIYLKDSKLLYYCFNCNYSASVEYWLKSYFPDSYNSYLTEFLQLNNFKLIDTSANIEIVNKTTEIEDKSHLKYFKSIIKHKSELADKAIEYCTNRRINKEVWKKWYVAIDGFYKNRLIIPFYNKNNKIYYWQGRTLYNQEPKYLNRLVDKPIYNIDHINKELPVIVTEGVIDANFINNSISVLSKSWSIDIDNQLKELECYYWLDNDLAGKEKSIELLKDGRHVFLWSKFVKDYGILRSVKDVNDAYIYLNRNSNFKFEELYKYFTNNQYDQFYLV